MDETEVVHLFGEMREEIGNHFPALAARPEFPGTAGERPLFTLEGDELFGAGQRPAMVANQVRFVIEGIELAAGTTAKDDQHVLGARGKMGGTRGKRTRRIDGRA